MGSSRRAGALVAMVLLFTSFVAPPPARAATVLHVPADHPTIASALAAAAAGDTVLVAPGTYLENVTVPGRVTLDSSDGPATTIIDGHRSGPVVVIQGGARVHGFTLQGGGETYGDVGGARVSGGTLDGNVLTDNGGCFKAGAAWLEGGTVSNNVFRNNRSWCTNTPVVAGAGTIVGNEFDEPFGGLVIGLNNNSPTIEGNTFRGSAQVLSIINDSQPLIRNNLFEVGGNHVYAGAIAWTVPSGRPGPTIVGNTFVMLPGATGTLVTAGGFDSTTSFANNVLVGPAGANLMDCQSGYDNLPPNLRANDAWTPSGSGLTGLCAGAVGTAGNVSVDPVFVSAITGDYHLRADSPLIDAGDNGVAMVPDVDGDVRPFDGNEDGTATADIGFDESVDPLAVVPGDIGFGSVPLARASNATVTLRNLGSTSLQVAAVQVSGPGAGDYATAGDSCSGATLVVGGSCSIPVAFTPMVLGQRAATLAIDVGGSPETRHVALTGTGVDPIELSPTQFRFDDVTVGDPGAPGSITVTNRGGAAATVDGITVTGNAADVTLGAETCTGGPLPQDGTCTLAFTWRPKDSGERAADIIISGPAPLGVRTIPVTGHAWPPPSGVAWGGSYTAGPAYAWNGGTALGRTVQSGRQRLHVVYATDRIGGRWATDSGPKVGVYYIRSSTGSTWTTPFRLNPTTQHATSMGLASAGAKVYAVWASQTRYVRFSPTAPRVLYVRVNTNHGSSSAWRSRIALSPSTGRVDYPVIAAYGTDAHIAYTNATTGTVSVRSSRDGGLHWVRTGLGSTSIAFRTGRTGFPAIAASGKMVAVCWLSDVAGTIKCRVSTNRGVTWGAATIVGSESTGYFSVAVRGSRIAVAWTTPSDVVIRQRLSGIWQAARTVPTPYRAELSGVNVALQDPQRIRLTWSDGEQDGDFAYVFSSESVDGGTMWFAFDNVGQPGQSRWRNDWPSMIWPAPGTRYAVWNGWTANTNTYRLYLRRGLGTPVGPWQSATLWTPGQATSTVRAPDTLEPRVRTPDDPRGGASGAGVGEVRSPAAP